MGSLFGGTTKTTTKSEPWAPQGAALTGAFNDAQSIYNNQKGTAAYSGSLYAGMDPGTAAAISNITGHTAGQGATNAGAITNAGHSLLDTNGLNGAIGNLERNANGDPTRSNITNAGMYADNPYMNGMIDAAARDVQRNLYENDLPGIDRAATATGNINSSRSGIAAGIAARGAQDQIGDISAAMRGSAYANGLGLSESARVANMDAQGQVAGLYGQKIGQGIDAIGAGDQMTMGHNAADVAATQLRQQDAQGQLDAKKASWDLADTRQNDLLARYYSIIGANNWGGTTENTRKTSGNIFGQLLGGAASLAGLGVFGGGKKK